MTDGEPTSNHCAQVQRAKASHAQVSNAKEQELKCYSVKEVAVLQGCGVSTVWARVKCGTLPPPIKIGGSARWTHTALVELQTALQAAAEQAAEKAKSEAA